MTDLDRQEREARSVSADLPFDEVARLVSFLPAARLRELAKGPLPELKPGDEGYATLRTCRVCVALDRMTSSGPAAVLLVWHDFVTESFELVEAMERDDEEPATVAQVQAFIGACSYARCSTLYALARAALARAALAACEEPRRPSDRTDDSYEFDPPELTERAYENGYKAALAAREDTCECDSCNRVFPLSAIEFGRGAKATCPECREDTERPDELLEAARDLMGKAAVLLFIEHDTEHPERMSEPARDLLAAKDRVRRLIVRDTEQEHPPGCQCAAHAAMAFRGAMAAAREHNEQEQER